MQSPTDLLIRPLESAHEFRSCVALQREIWGPVFEQCVPAEILSISSRIGGLVAGAFAGDGALVGFSFSMLGDWRGEIVHWSDMTGVRSEWRGRGIGGRLKLFQRDWVLGRGLKTVMWSYDPLVARNARLNLDKLGAMVVDYVREMYAADVRQDLRALPTDRFIVAWHLRSARVEGRLRAPSDPAHSLVLSPERILLSLDGSPTLSAADAGRLRLTDGPLFVEIPDDLEARLDGHHEAMTTYQQEFRTVTESLLARSFRPVGTVRDATTGRLHYAFEHEAP